MVTMGKEAHDDYKRNQRDKEANSAKYLILDPSSSSRNPQDTENGYDNSDENDDTQPDAPLTAPGGPHTKAIPSSKIRVGDLVYLEKNQRVPADMILLRTSDSSGTCFIRTDQLDGETDWKLRVAVPSCQALKSDRDLLRLDAEIYGMILSIVQSLT
jgi:phospholipid-translocating ATPase